MGYADTTFPRARNKGQKTRESGNEGKIIGQETLVPTGCYSVATVSHQMKPNPPGRQGTL